MQTYETRDHEGAGHELFEADRPQLIETVVFDGLVGTTDPATGKAVRPCLVTLRTTRETFTELNLAKVDPAACLQHLNASVSKRPENAGTCFVVELAGTPYCLGNGVEYCKLVDGVVTFLIVSGESRNDRPNLPASLTVELDAQWDLTSCPPSIDLTPTRS